jgi:hypothetical protein
MSGNQKESGEDNEALHISLKDAGTKYLDNNMNFTQKGAEICQTIPQWLRATKPQLGSGRVV